MNRAYWGRLGMWAAVVAGVAFCLYWALTGTASAELFVLFAVLGVVASHIGFTLERNASSNLTFGMSMLTLASLEDTWFHQPSPSPAMFSILGAASIGLGLICFWLARWRGAILKSFWFGPSSVTWGERIILLCFFAMLGWALFITVSYATQQGWDVWRAIRGMGQGVLLLLIGRALLPRRRMLPAAGESSDMLPPLGRKP